MEKELKFNVGKISSKASVGSYSTCFEVVPQDPEEVSRGTLLAVLAVAASSSFDAEAASGKIFEALAESFYAQKAGGILVALENAIETAHQKLLTIVFAGGNETAVDFDIVAGVVWGSVFYLAQLGNGKAVIRRGESLRLIGRKSVVTEDLSAADSPEVLTASGMLREGDVIALGTPKFFEKVSNEELERVLSKDEMREVVRELREKTEDVSAAAALIVSMKDESEMNSGALDLEPESDKDKEVADDVSEKAAVLRERAAGMVEKMPSWERVKERIDKYLAEGRSKLGPMGEGVGSRVSQMKRQYAKKGASAVLSEKAKQVWDQLGRPRTAVEGVDQARNRRTLLLLAGVLMVILVLGVSINHMVRGSGKDKTRFDNLVSTAQGQYDEAQQAQSIDKSRAQELLSSAASNLQEAGGMHVDDKRVSDLQGKVGALEDSLSGVSAVSPNVLIDLPGLRPGAQGAAMVGNGSSLYVLDGSGALYGVDPASKKGTVLSSDVALRHGTSVAQVGNSIFSYMPGEGIYGYDLKSKKLGLAMGMSANWGKIVGMVGFQNYLYLLDPGKNMIWRYTVSGGQLGSATTWLKSGTGLGGASSIAIDGSVWLGEKGNVAKLVQGASSAFSVSGLSPGLGQVGTLYTSPDTRKIYLVDGSRMAVIDKNGQVAGQYKSDKFGKVSGLVVDEMGGKAYILSGSKVYQFDLR